MGSQTIYMTFPYTRLVSPTAIRLLLLRHGDKDDTLSCSIHDRDLQDEPEYQALSYVWGDETDREVILCDGLRVSITRSLAAALRDLRSLQRPADRSPFRRWLWADALCINQKDDEEVAQQIRIMGRIYKQSFGVNICLGDASSTTKMAVSYILFIVKVMFSRLEELQQWQPIRLTSEERRTKSEEASDRMHEANGLYPHFGLKPPTAPEYAALKELYDRPWFRRAWTFQEAFLAKKRIYRCGSHSLHGFNLMFAAKVLADIHRITQDPRILSYDSVDVKSMWTIESHNMSGVHREYTLVELLSFRRGSGCKYTRDLIYSLLGCASNGAGFDINLSESFQQLFTQVLIQVTNERNDLSILSYVHRPSGAPNNLPSWLPDWRFKRRHANFSGRDRRLYYAAGASKPSFSISEDSQELTLQGLAVDTIATIHDTPKDVNLDKIRLRGQETATETFFRTQAADLDVYNADDTPRRAQLNFGSKLDAILGADDGDRARIFWQMGFRNGVHMSTFKTHAGWLGNCTNEARVGYVIVVVLGGEVPLVLRPEGADRYTFIDECYVHGIMDGEAFIEARSQQDPLFDVEDREWLKHLDDGPIPFPTKAFRIA